MQPHFTLIGLLLFIGFIIYIRILTVYRTVKSIKTHMKQLSHWRDEAIQKGVCGVHYEKAHHMMYGIQKQKLKAVRQSFFGSIVAFVLGDKWYEDTHQRSADS